MSDLLDRLSAAASDAGTLSKFADALGIKHQSLYSWKRVPAERVLEVERVTRIPRHELRPDLYPVPAKRRRA